MIKLTKITGDEFYLNPDVLKFIEDCGDTILTFTSGERLMVRETSEEVAELFISYKKEMSQALPFATSPLPAGVEC